METELAVGLILMSSALAILMMVRLGSRAVAMND